MKKIFSIVIILLIICGCKNSKSNKITIVTTSFPGYDFARSIVKDSDIEVKMLLKPGSEMHDYEPTPQDIIDIKNSDLFIYVGGESEEWINDILDDIDKDDNDIVRLMDLVDLKDEEIKEGMDADTLDREYDEHVWTSPMNAIMIIDSLKDNIIKIDPDNENLYLDNSLKYIDDIKKIDNEIRDILSTSKRKEIIFGDRFPLLYFVNEYGIDYYAAFPGCSEQTEPSSKTLAFLIDKVKKDNIPVVFHIELSDSKVASAIAYETGSKVMEFHSAHNISQADYDNGVTYVDLMNRNISALKEALN